MTELDSSLPPSRESASSAPRSTLVRRAASVGSAGLLASAATAAAVASGMGVAGAATFSVTECTDAGSGSLRQAILDANATAGVDTITISATCTGAQAVPVGLEMSIDEGVLIVGPGAALFVLDGGGDQRILDIDAPEDVSISGITFQNAASDSGTDGGAIIFGGSGNFVIDACVFTGNQSGEDGGALYAGNATTLTITNTTFVDNTANNSGGALYLLSTDGPTVISNSLFAGNVAGESGGAIAIYENTGSLLVANSTITGNTAAGVAGAVFIHGLYNTASFLFNTVVDNQSSYFGGLMVNDQNESITLTGNIFSGNFGTSLSDDTQVRIGEPWTVTTADNDYFGSVSGFTPDASDLDVDPMLELLADNGGPTRTRALMASSPVLNLGPVTIPTFPGNEFDQRGTPYVREYGGRSDMGAYEAQPQPEPTPPQPEPEPVTPSFTG